MLSLSNLLGKNYKNYFQIQIFQCEHFYPTSNLQQINFLWELWLKPPSFYQHISSFIIGLTGGKMSMLGGNALGKAKMWPNYIKIFRNSFSQASSVGTYLPWTIEYWLNNPWSTIFRQSTMSSLLPAYPFYCCRL